MNLNLDTMSVNEKLLAIELIQLRKGAQLMAEHIMAQPAIGLDQVAPVRMIASQILAARGTGSTPCAG